MRSYDQLFQIDFIIAEEQLCLFLCHRHLFFQLILPVDPADTTSAAAGRCLYQYRIADLCGDLLRLFHRGHSAVRAGDDRNAGCLHGLLGTCLVAQHGDRRRGRTDKGDAVVDAQLRKLCALGQKAESGMQCLCAGVLAGRDQRIHVQIAVLYRRRSDADRFIGDLCVQRRFIRSGIDRHALQSCLTAGTDDAHGNFTTICN